MTKTVGLTNGIAILFYTLQSVYTENICPTTSGEKVVHVCEGNFATGTSVYLDTFKAVNYEGGCTCQLRAQGGAVDLQVSVQGVHAACDATLYFAPPIDHTYNCADKTPATTTGKIQSGQSVFLSLSKSSDVADFCVHLVQTSTAGSLNVVCIEGTLKPASTTTIAPAPAVTTSPTTIIENACLSESGDKGTTHTSKACYGSPGRSCTKHDISCSSNQKIAICDAYYTDNTECGAGLPNCATVNPDNVSEHGHHRFSNAELVSLYNSCSTETRCVYPATRRGSALVFSVVKYQCIGTSDPFNVKCETETVTSTVGFNTGSTWGRSPVSTSSQFPAGVFVGGVAVGVVIVILIGLAVYVFVVRRRYDLTVKKQGDIPASIEHPTYSGLSAGAAVNNYDIIEQTSKFQGDTVHEVVATPDYQNL